MRQPFRNLIVVGQGAAGLAAARFCSSPTVSGLKICAAFGGNAFVSQFPRQKAA
jgi:thioredoxin reductase